MFLVRQGSPTVIPLKPPYVGPVSRVKFDVLRSTRKIDLKLAIHHFSRIKTPLNSPSRVETRPRTRLTAIKVEDSCTRKWQSSWKQQDQQQQREQYERQKLIVKNVLEKCRTLHTLARFLPGVCSRGVKGGPKSGNDEVVRPSTSSTYWSKLKSLFPLFKLPWQFSKLCRSSCPPDYPPTHPNLSWSSSCIMRYRICARKNFKSFQ